MVKGICKLCGRFYKPNGLDYCDSCYKEYKEKYEIIREYLSNHGNASILELTRETKVPIKLIRHFLENDALFLTIHHNE